MTHNKIEPRDSIWICACKYLPESNGLSAVTRESYLKIHPNELKIISRTTHPEYVDAFRDKVKASVCTLSCDGNNMNDHLIIAKISNNATIVKIAKHLDITTIPALHSGTLENVVLSSVRLLGVEYVCGDLPPIAIEIPKSHYAVDNEILSNAYILRYLEHLPMYSNWIFVENEYKIKVIDCDSNVVSMNSNNFILLEKDEYKIMYRTPLYKLNIATASSSCVNQPEKESTEDFFMENPLIHEQEQEQEQEQETKEHCKTD